MQGHLKLLFKKGPLTLGDMKMKPVNIVKTEQQECGSSSKIRHQRMLSFIDKNYERTLLVILGIFYTDQIACTAQHTIPGYLSAWATLLPHLNYVSVMM
ncbi:hypothetical protein X798_02425 [Onchocerca flexuosa]|uniref:Uncharacterized protein n=1 Tax=Onchocerca flexuosa TaxID=387005 RepID=A0A238C0L2_9BILA|nr:hypothetical protein X798_02425 [Onchocerca flexuosa]